MSELRALCEQILTGEDEVKGKVEKVDMALCHVDELRNRVCCLRDALANGETGEEVEETIGLAREVASEMREIAWEHRQKIREYNCERGDSEEQNVG